MRRILLGSRARLAAVIVMAVTCAFASVPVLDGPGVIREFERIAEHPPWPNFAPSTIPVAVYDGSRTWLFHHPAPPPEFVPVPGMDGMRVADGRYPAITANTSVNIGGVLTATLHKVGSTTTVRQAAVLMHETFHVYQKQRHPEWAANEADFFLYPLDKPEPLQLRRLESEALKRALDATGEQCRCWALAALDLRAARFAQLPPSAAEYERRTELNEGLAQYVEDKAAGEVRADLLPAGEFAPDEVRLRAYSTGEALALLLDRFDPPTSATAQDPHRFFGNWREDLDTGKGKFLDQVLERRLAGAKPCQFYAPEKRAALQRAENDVAQLQKQRDQALRDFQAQPGWRVIVESSDNKFGTQGFDPLNISVVGSGLILHKRYLKAGGSAGTLELIDGRALTEAAGSNPMFSGIRRITITGLASAPSMTEKDGGVNIAAAGLKADFTKASVSVDDAAKQVTISF